MRQSCAANGQQMVDLAADVGLGERRHAATILIGAAFRGRYFAWGVSQSVNLLVNQLELIGKRSIQGNNGLS